MRANALVMIGLALLFGALAVFASRTWLDMQANQRLSEIETARQPTQTATIVVADQPLRFGAELNARSLREIPWPADALPEGAFATIPDVLAEDTPRVLSAIEANEPVLATKITGPGERGTLSAKIEDGKRAVTVQVNDIAGVAGFVLPGDRVDVVHTQRLERDDTVADVLLQGVRVLAIDQLADDRTDTPAVARAVTLEVDTRAAQALNLAAQVGQLSLALRRAGETGTEITRRLTLRDLAPAPLMAAVGPAGDETGEDNGVAENAIEDNAYEAFELNGPVRSNANVAVMRATERTEYTVPISRIE